MLAILRKIIFTFFLTILLIVIWKSIDQIYAATTLCTFCCNPGCDGANGGVAPSPTPSPTPTPTPTPPPGGLVNAEEWPASFTPYAATSPWNRILPDTGAIKYVNSDVIVAHAYPNTGLAPYVMDTATAGSNDYSHPIYFSTDTDPLINTICTLYCNGLEVPAQIRIPAKARSTGGGDHHMAIVQPDGTEIDFWGATGPYLASNSSSTTGLDYQSGNWIKYYSGNTCGNFYTGTGFKFPDATAGDGCLAGGVIRQSELAAGAINHALFLVTNCTSPTVHLFPSSANGGSHCTDGSGLNIPMGARVQLTLTDAQINALSVSVWQKTILHAMHRYGGYIMDTDTGGARTTRLLYYGKPESPAPYAAFGVTPPLDTQAATWGWNFTNGHYISTDNWAIDLGAYVIVVDPCYALGTCS